MLISKTNRCKVNHIGEKDLHSSKEQMLQSITTSVCQEVLFINDVQKPSNVCRYVTLREVPIEEFKPVETHDVI